MLTSQDLVRENTDKAMTERGLRKHKGHLPGVQGTVACGYKGESPRFPGFPKPVRLPLSPSPSRSRSPPCHTGLGNEGDITSGRFYWSKTRDGVLILSIGR